MRRATLFLIIVLLSTPAFAHREDFIGETLVFLTLERQALEPELFIDFGHAFRMYNAALEYGVTDHSMVDGRVTFDRTGGFDSARIEARHRFAEEGTWPVDVAASLEGNVERRGDERETAIEPRIVLSKDFHELNVTLNVADEIGFHGSGSELRLSSGVRYDATELIRAGAEVQYGMRSRMGSVVPQFWIVLPHDMTLKGGYFAGFHGSPSFVRLAAELDF